MRPEDEIIAAYKRGEITEQEKLRRLSGLRDAQNLASSVRGSGSKKRTLGGYFKHSNLR
jgi:hypothetical protein